MDVVFFIYVSMALFAIGVIGVLAKRNTLIFFLSIELMLNAANLLFVAFSRQWGNSIGQYVVIFTCSTFVRLRSLLSAAASSATWRSAIRRWMDEPGGLFCDGDQILISRTRSVVGGGSTTRTATC